MRITRDTIGSLPLDDFVEAVAGIYADKDTKRSVWDVWLHTVHHAASIGEEARKYKPGTKLYEEIADFSMWLFTFVGKIRRSLGSRPEYQSEVESAIRTEVALSDLIWNKYPRVCPICFGRRMDQGITLSDATKLTEACDCLLYEVERRGQKPMTSEEKTTMERRHTDMLRQYAEACRENDRPKSVNEWQEVFQTIFASNLRHLSLTSIAFHLLEEVGEVSDAMVRMYTYTKPTFAYGEPTWRRKDLENEIADVCSWLFTLVNHLQVIPDIVKEYEIFLYQRETSAKEQIKLSSIIWGRYGDDKLERLHCPHCKEPEKCRCEIVLVPYDADVTALKRIERELT